MSQTIGNTHQQRAVSRAMDPRLFLPWSAAAARDRLSSTLFLAGLLHGIILLGVTFSAADAPPESSVTSFDVVLVTNETPDQAAENDADLLAQQNMVGAGNTQDPLQLQTAINQTNPAEALGPEQTGQQRRQQLNPASVTDRPTVVSRSAYARAAIPEQRNNLEYVEQQQARSFEGQSNAIEIVNKPEPETLISDNEPRELIISANTREARIAAYLSRWKNRVERVGTLNFPTVVDGKPLTRFPTLEVAIDSDGALNEVILRNSSGNRSLDQEAMNIVRMSAPFDPFPEFLRAEYDVLRFAYEWRFTDSFVSSRGNR